MPSKSLQQISDSWKHLSKNIGLYSVKSAAIFIVSIYYFFFSSIMSIAVNNLVPNKSEEELKRMPMWQLAIEISIIVGVIAVGYYLVRNLLSNGPLLVVQWLLEGWHGYQHDRLKEANSGGVIVAMAIFFFQVRLNRRLRVFTNRLSFTDNDETGPVG